MRSYHLVAIRQQPVDKAVQNLPLQRGRKIGEGDVPAEDEIEHRRRCLRPQVLIYELDAFAKHGLDAEKPPLRSKACSIRCGGNSCRLVALKQPSCARASIVSSMSKIPEEKKERATEPEIAI